MESEQWVAWLRNIVNIEDIGNPCQCGAIASLNPENSPGVVDMEMHRPELCNPQTYITFKERCSLEDRAPERRILKSRKQIKERYLLKELVTPSCCS